MHHKVEHANRESNPGLPIPRTRDKLQPEPLSKPRSSRERNQRRGHPDLSFPATILTRPHQSIVTKPVTIAGTLALITVSSTFATAKPRPIRHLPQTRNGECNFAIEPKAALATEGAI